MNRIVREHYPVGRLPADLREGLDPNEPVRVEIEGKAAPPSRPTLEQMQAWRSQLQETADDPAARIRALRDEWDE